MAKKKTTNQVASTRIAKKVLSPAVRPPRTKSSTTKPVVSVRKVRVVAAKKRSKSDGPSLLPGADSYLHAEPKSALRPDIGTQAQFKAKKPPTKYKYDSSLSPELEWDAGNIAREQGKTQLAALQTAVAALRRQISEISFDKGAESKAQKEALQRTLTEADAAIAKLKSLSKPFLNWTGKGERLSFDVPALPLFVHERLSTEAIIETLSGHRRSHETQLTLFGDTERSITDQVLRPYEHGDWVNRLILGDSLVVMNSLLQFESLGGQVQMIYMDPPYGVKFGSNFQPFVKKRDVKHGDDADMTREPEMVQAYRDTWELGLHSYLTYLRDRLLIARDLLTPSGSIFVQISDENLHHVREVMDEVFGAENFCGVIPFKKTGGQSSAGLASVADFLLWYARAAESTKYRQLFLEKVPGLEGATNYTWIELSDGTRRPLTAEEKRTWRIPDNAKVFQPYPMFSEGPSPTDRPFKWNGSTYHPAASSHWKTTENGLKRLSELNRLIAQGNTLRYVNYLSDYPVTPITNLWMDTQISGFAEERLYVVQTLPRVIQRCVLMTTDPGDLVVDPTCGSGTTPYVAEQWGRRWISIDTSRVPLALARQRLLTATFDWYRLRNPERGPAGGFVYERKQNRRGEEVGGIVPHVTLKNIANNELPREEVLVDRPETDDVVRVTGRFCVEATIPTPVEWDEKIAPVESAGEQYASFTDRMIEILRKSPTLHLAGNQTVQFKQIRPPTKSLSLSAEALVDATAAGQKVTLADAVQGSLEKDKRSLEFSTKPVAIVFGPENGPVSSRLVENAAREAHGKQYTHLYVFGFAIEAKARESIENCDGVFGIPAAYIQATPDVLMGDLLKNMRSSQIFSVCGLPDVKIHKATDGKIQVELKGLDVFDPITMENQPYEGNNVPAWFLDTDYNDLCFHVCQAFFPRTSAWDNIQKALKSTHEESVWDHLAGTTSAAFEPGDHQKIAVKVIDDRGNELLVVKSLKEVKKK